jgi:DNA-binding response OmpR family regulator
MKLPSMLHRSKKVLIVEDDVTLRKSLADKFTERGFEVREASSSEEVFTLLGREEPHLFVLDLILPIKDGISLLEELRTNGFKQPVIILSNLLGSDDLRADAARLHATFYNKSSTSLEEIVENAAKELA